MSVCVYLLKTPMLWYGMCITMTGPTQEIYGGGAYCGGFPCPTIKHGGIKHTPVILPSQLETLINLRCTWRDRGAPAVSCALSTVRFLLAR